ncbi:MAG TPA: MFS transporter [Gemmataceae bacterium]|nr:MFS transporter [Gemmataceae bacterium]
MQSWVGLCATSFFLAEMHGVTMPFVNAYLIDQGWRYDAIGTVAALTGLVSLLMNSPSGLLVDHVHHRQALMAGGAILIGCCFGLFPLVPASYVWIGTLLVAAAVVNPLFGPLNSALTLGLVGHNRLSRALGITQGWDHAGNILAALTAMALVRFYPVTSIFYSVAVASALSACAALLIRTSELNDRRAGGLSVAKNSPSAVRFRDLLRDWRIGVLLVSAALFHLANAPAMPLVAQKIQSIGGSSDQLAGVVLAAQAVMIPVALLAGWLGDSWGRKPVFAIGFIVLPIRIALYALSDDPGMLVALQTLDGVGAGIFGVTAMSMCADLTKGRGHFNALVGVLATAGGLGGVVGPLAGGLIVQHLGFDAAFYAFAGVAVAAAVLFVGWMPETQTRPSVISH